MVRLLASAMALLLASCDCDEGVAELRYVPIDTDCDAPPCDWEGLAGEVAVVSLYHRGLPGLRLHGGDAVARAVRAFEIPAGPHDGVAIRALLACDPDTRLHVTLEAQALGSSPDDALDDPISFAATLSDPEAEVAFGRAHAQLTSGAHPDGGHPRLSGRRVVLSVEGPGACTVGDLRFLGLARRLCQ